MGGDIVLIDLAGTCKCGNEPSGSIKYGELLDQLRLVSFSRRNLLHRVTHYYNTPTSRLFTLSKFKKKQKLDPTQERNFVSVNLLSA